MHAACAWPWKRAAARLQVAAVGAEHQAQRVARGLADQLRRGRAKWARARARRWLDACHREGAKAARQALQPCDAHARLVLRAAAPRGALAHRGDLAAQASRSALNRLRAAS